MSDGTVQWKVDTRIKPSMMGKGICLMIWSVTDALVGGLEQAVECINP